MSRRLPVDLREVRSRLARDEGMAAVAAVVTELRRLDVEPPAEVVARVAEHPPLLVLCCRLTAALRQP